MSKESTKGKNTRSLILEAATNLFLQNGYNNVSLNEVALESGIKKSSLYHHFPNKKQIFSEVIDLILPKTTRWIDALKDESIPFKDLLRNHFDNLGEINKDLFETAGDHNVGAHYLMMDAVKIFPDMSKRFESIQEEIGIIFLNRVTQAQKEGSMRKDLDLEVFMFQLDALVQGAIYYGLMIPSIDLNDMGKRMFDSFWRGFEGP